QDREDEVRPSRRKPSGQGSRHWARSHHQPKPWFCCRSCYATSQSQSDARLAIRWLAPGLRAHGSAGVLLPGASRGEPRAARYRLFVRPRSEEHTSELQSLAYLVCRLLLEKKKK